MPTPTPALFAFVRTVMLRYESLNACCGTDEECTQGPNPNACEADCGELAGAESPDDHRVDDAHGGDQDLAEYEGRGEGRHFAQATGLIGDPSGVLFVESHEFIPGRDSA